MIQPASSATPAPRPRQLLYYVLMTLWFGTGVFRADRPWQFWLAFALTCLGVSCVHAWVQEWRRHRMTV